MSKNSIKKGLVLTLTLCILFLSTLLYSSAHNITSWANYYPASSANSTYSFGIMNSYHINANEVKYCWNNSTAKSYFNQAVTESFSICWKNLITGTEVSNLSAANVELKYDPITQPANQAAVTTVYLYNGHYGLGNNTTEITFYKDTKNYSQSSKRIVSAHEFGHLWGIDDLYEYNTSLSSIYSQTYNYTYATRHDRNAMRIALNDLWFNPGSNQIWKYQVTPGIFILRGDIDQDGTISANDSRLALRYSTNSETPTNLQFKLADVDGNGQITAADSQSILSYSVNLISNFPADIYED